MNKNDKLQSEYIYFHLKIAHVYCNILFSQRSSVYVHIYTYSYYIVAVALCIRVVRMCASLEYKLTNNNKCYAKER